MYRNVARILPKTFEIEFDGKSANSLKSQSTETVALLYSGNLPAHPLLLDRWEESLLAVRQINRQEQCRRVICSLFQKEVGTFLDTVISYKYMKETHKRDLSIQEAEQCREVGVAPHYPR